MRQRRSATYRSFLLRCWQEGGPEIGQVPMWRFMLQEISDEPQQQGFGSLQQLVDFLSLELWGETGSEDSEKGGLDGDDE